MSDLTPQPPLRRRHDPADAEPPAARPAPAPDLAGADVLPSAPPRLQPPVIEAPSEDVVAAPASSRIPGAARDGYSQLPTAPVIAFAEGPVEGESVAWEPPPPRRRASVGPWALGLSIVALAASIFVGWMLPLGLAGIVTAIVALRRPRESRAVGVWALVLGVVSVLYSVGWLVWAIPQLPGL
jgi:hypothetical protein